MTKTRLYARESVAFDHVLTIRDAAGDPIDITGWAFACALTRQTGSTDIALAAAASSGAQGFEVVDGPAGALRVVIDQASLAGVGDTTGDFTLFGDLLGTPGGGTAKFAGDLRLNVTDAGVDFPGGDYSVVVAGSAAVLVQQLQPLVDEAAGHAATAAGLVAQASGLADPANAHPVFGHLVGQPKMYGGDPAKFYYLERLYFTFDNNSDGKADTLRIDVWAADDAAGTGGALVAQLGEPGAGRSGVQMVTIPPFGGSGVTIELPLDFGDGSPWGQAIFSAGTFANAGLSNKAIIDTQNWKDSVTRVVATALAVEDRRDEGPWYHTVRDEQLRDDIVFARGWFTQDGHRYGISSIELADFSVPLGYHRANITIRDFTTGADVSQGGQIFYDDPTGEEHWIICSKGTMPHYTGKIFLVKIGANATWLPAPARTFTLYGQAGFRDEVCASANEVESFVSNPPLVDEEIKIGAGGDFATLTAAHNAQYNEAFNTQVEDSKNGVYPNANAGYGRKLGFYLPDPGHREEVSALRNIPFSVRRGSGPFSTYFSNREAGKRLFETTYSVWNIDFAAEQFVNEYLDHIDNFNALSKLAEAGDPVQNFRILQGFLRVWYRAHGADASQGAPSCIGEGISSWQTQRFIASVFEQVSGQPIPAIFLHNTPNMHRGGIVSFEQGTVVSNGGVSRALQLMSSFGQSTRTEIQVDASCHIEGGILGNVLVADADPLMPARARDRWAYEVRGRLTDPGGGALDIFVDDPKMRVLTLDPGTTITTASGVATALFGYGYDSATGRGEALTLDGSTQALATKLAGLQGAAMSISRVGVTPEAITIGDYTGMAEGAILAALNAQLANFLIGAVRIDGEIGVVS